MCESVLGPGTSEPIYELDSHANMMVLGKNPFVFEETGRTCNVQPFSTDMGIATDVPISDGAIEYDCPYAKTTYTLIVRNDLHMPIMQQNIIPHFIMRAGGVIVSDVPNIHFEDPTIEDN